MMQGEYLTDGQNPEKEWSIAPLGGNLSKVDRSTPALNCPKGDVGCAPGLSNSTPLRVAVNQKGLFFEAIKSKFKIDPRGPTQNLTCFNVSRK